MGVPMPVTKPLDRPGQLAVKIWQKVFDFYPTTKRERELMRMIRAEKSLTEDQTRMILENLPKLREAHKQRGN